MQAIELSLVPIIVGVTGHRDLREEDIDTLKSGVRGIFNELRSNYPDTPLLVLSPLADGADRLVAEVALENAAPGETRATLIVTLPLPKAEYENDFDDRSKVDFAQLLEQSAAWFELPLVDGNTPENIREHGLPRDLQYEHVGNYVATRSQILIALWDGVESGLVGGTSQIVSSRLKGIPAKDASPLDIGEIGPIYHILTPRRKNPEIIGRPGSQRDIYPNASNTDKVNSNLSELTFTEILSRMDDFNSTAKRLAPKLTGEIEKNRRYVIPDERLDRLSARSARLLSQFALADTLAIYYREYSSRVLISLVAIAVLAVISFGVYAHLLTEPWVLALYPVALGTGYLTHSLARRWNIQSKHLDYRALAEGLRVQLFWRLAGLDDEVGDHYLRKQRTELDWIRNAIRNATIPTSNAEVEETAIAGGNDVIGSNLEELVLEHWVRDQMKYFQDSSGRDSSESSRQNNRVRLFFGAGLLFSIGVVFLDTQFRSVAGYTEWHHWLIVLTGTAPAIAAFIGGYAEKMAFSAQAKRYHWMGGLFGRATAALEAYLSKNKVKEAQELIRDLGKEALLENGDWVIIHREREIEVPKG